MERIPEEDRKSGRNRETWRARVAADLQAARAEQERLWGGIDEMTLARYEAGVSPDEERTRVERAMHDHPALRECMEMGRQFSAGREIAPVDDSRRKRRG